MPDRLTDKAIVTRVRLATSFMEQQGRLDRAACKAFRDSASIGSQIFRQDDEWSDSADTPFYQSVGRYNILAVNLMTKLAAIAVGDPDVHVEVDYGGQQDIDEPTAVTVCKKWWRSQWRAKNWKRVAGAAMLKASMAGLGFVRYYWTDEGPQFEHVPAWRVGVDPNVTDWQNLKFAVVCVRMSLRNALLRYPNSKWLRNQAREVSENESLDSRTSAVEVNIYHDIDTLYVDRATGEETVGIEAHIINEEVVFRGANLYGQVPLIVYEGNIDPGPSPFPIGDYQIAAGLQAGYSDIASIIFNKAKNNGPITVYAPSRFDRAAQDALKEGQYNQWLPAKSTSLANDPPVIRIPGEEITQAEIEAKREMEQAIDAAMAITQYQRGVINQSVNFATEAAILANQSGARPVAARLEYEAFLTKIAALAFWMLQQFGGPRFDEDGMPFPITDEHLTLWEYAQGIREVRIIEGSTSFKDPAIDQQQSMQLFELAMRHITMLLQLSSAGIVDKVPNVVKLFEDVLRAFGRQEMDNYFLPTGLPVQVEHSAVPGSAAEAVGGPAASEPATAPNAPDMIPAPVMPAPALPNNGRTR